MVLNMRLANTNQYAFLLKSRAVSAAKLLLCMAVPFAGVSSAQAKSNVEPVTIKLIAQKALVTNGTERFVAANEAKPGDTIRYKATYKNNTTGTIQGLTATLPIPTNMSYTGKSFPNGALASTDGKVFAQPPLKKKVNGKWVKVPLSEYRELRWQLKSLPAGKTFVVSAKAQINKEN